MGDELHPVLRWTFAALATLGAAFGVLLVTYQMLGWPETHAAAGSVLAAGVLAGTVRITKRSRESLRPAMTNAIAVVGVISAFVALPAGLHAALATAARVSPIDWPHGALFDVPSLAEDEPVRGTGCGAHTASTKVTPTSIPDGTWFGIVRTVDPTSSLEFDLVCAYASEDQAALNPAYAELAARDEIVRHPAARPTWLTLNASSRVRTVPLATNFRYREAKWSDAGACADAPGRSMPVVSDVEVWLVITDGQAVLAVRTCDLAHPPT